MTQIYYDNFGVKVTDTMFIAPTGDQYPIRNISSVQVRIQSGVGAFGKIII
jgi:hypothetical protein